MKMIETKILRYGTTLMPTVVKNIVGSFPGGLVESVSGRRPTQFSDITIEGKARRQLEMPLLEARYPSVSCIIGCTHYYRGLWFWQLRMIKQFGGLAQLRRYMRERVSVGLKFHAAIKKLLLMHRSGELLGKSDDELCDQLDETILCYVRSALPLLRSFDQTNEIFVEQYAFHPDLYYYGRFDAIIRYKDTFFLVDFKTKSDGSMKDTDGLHQLYAGPLQVAAYVGAVNCTPTYAALSTINSGAIVNVKENGSEADFIEINSSCLQESWNVWLRRVQRFWYEISNRPTKDGAVSFLYDGSKR